MNSSYSPSKTQGWLTLFYYLKQFDVFFKAKDRILSLEIAANISLEEKNV